MTITVFGTPGPQGSKRYVGQAKSGKGIMIESSPKVKIWREAVKCAAVGIASSTGYGAVSPVNAWGRMDGPIIVEMIFTIPKPKSAPKRIRTYPDRKPDLSKLVRSTEDALTDAGVWEDDARVIRLTASKVYPCEGTDALHIPGAVIRISEAKE